jgi:major tropism determinant Mtd-like protein
MGSYQAVSYTAAQFLSLNPVLGLGEIGTESDTGKFKVGDGATAWENLLYGYPPTGGANGLQAVVDFGILTPEETTASVTVAATWVTATTKLVCSVVEGEDHTADEIAAEQVTATVGSVIPGTSIQIVLSSLNGSTGKFLVTVVGY